MKYSNAPIREAIFDIRVDSLGVSNIEKLKGIHEFISDSYPVKQERIKFQGKIELKNEKENKPFSTSIEGFVFKSKDNKKQVQIRLDGFTFNLVGPYSDWDEFSSEALRLFQIYVDELKPNKITRIALRFINSIKIPTPFGDFSDYIINMPPIPKCLPQTFSNFFMRIEVPYDDKGTNVILTETMEPTSTNYLPFILDIDAYRRGDFKIDNKILINEFSKLRDLKNSTFEDSITDKTRDLFN